MQDNGKSKTTLCIEMLTKLNTGKIYKVSELADILETNPRNIVEYKRELEDAGYYIVSIPGKNGGYKLDKTQMFPVLKLTEDEKAAFASGCEYVLSKGDFLYKKQYESAYAKVNTSIEQSVPIHETTIVPGVTFAMSNEELLQRYNTIQKCIAKKLKLEIKYLSTDNVVRPRIIHPYEMFIYNNAWYVIGYSEDVEDIRYYKINRIRNYGIVDAKFRVSYAYRLADYIDDNGFKIGTDWSGTSTKNRTEWIHVILQFTGKPAMYVQEYLFGKNQTITPVDKDTTILECDMHYKYNTIKFVMQFGADCKVIEPQWLKDEVKECHKKAIETD